MCVHVNICIVYNFTYICIKSGENKHSQLYTATHGAIIILQSEKSQMYLQSLLIMENVPTECKRLVGCHGICKCFWKIGYNKAFNLLLFYIF